MVTVYRFHVYYKIQSKSGKSYRRQFESVAFASSDIALAALRSWARFHKECYADSGSYFEVLNYFVDSTIEELPIDELYGLSDCERVNCYAYAREY